MTTAPAKFTNQTNFTDFPNLNLPTQWYKVILESNLFKNCSAEQLNELQPFLEEVHFHAGEVIIEEGELSREIYLILEGQVEVIKSLTNDKTTTLTVLRENNYFGEMALLNEHARSATIKAIKPVTLLKISAGFLHQLDKTEKSTFGSLAINLATNLANHLQSTTKLTIEALKNELALNKNRIAGGHFIVYTLTLLTMYILTINAISLLASQANSTTLITAPVIILYSIGSFMMMKHTDYPLSLFGFNLDNWRRNLIEAIIWSAIFCSALTVLKAILIIGVPAYHHIPLLDIKATLNVYHSDKVNLGAILLFFSIYTVTAPLQEIIFRGAIQSLLANFLTGKYASTWAILLSTMMFCIAHLHVGIWFALIVFIPSLFWGVLYARQQSLLGPILSHILIGWWVLYGLGVERFL